MGLFKRKKKEENEEIAEEIRKIVANKEQKHVEGMQKIPEQKPEVDRGIKQSQGFPEEVPDELPPLPSIPTNAEAGNLEAKNLISFEQDTIKAIYEQTVKLEKDILNLQAELQLKTTSYNNFIQMLKPYLSSPKQPESEVPGEGIDREGERFPEQEPGPEQYEQQEQQQEEQQQEEQQQEEQEQELGPEPQEVVSVTAQQTKPIKIPLGIHWALCTKCKKKSVIKKPYWDGKAIIGVCKHCGAELRKVV